MRVLFYASNPEGEKTLRLEHEITELQRTCSSSGKRMEFIFLPALPFEDLEEQIASYRPDVVHISAHGMPDDLILADADESGVKLTAEALRALLASQPPKLVYINACKSEALAAAIVDTVPSAIGTTEAITNFAARKGAVNFYRKIARGHSIADAFRSSSATIETLSGGKVSAVLAPHGPSAATSTILYEPTRLVAYFEDHSFDPEKDGGYAFQLGVAGCPPCTIQIVFCTDDETFIGADDDEEDEDEKSEEAIAAQLCSAVRTTPVRGEIWLEDSWADIYGDFRLYAFGTTATGESFSIGCMVCDALENFYKVYYQSPDGSLFPDKLKKALADLRSCDGSELRPKEAPRTGRRSQTREKKGA